MRTCFLILLLVFASCVDFDNYKNIRIGLDGVWKVVSFQNEEGEMVQLVENELLTIRFTNGNTLGGTASCNRYGGEYLAMINGDLLITKIFSTEIACLQPSNGDLFLQSLSNVDSYKVANGRLILLFEKSGKLQLRERYN